MEKSLLLATFKSWNPEKARYEAGKSQGLISGANIEFGGISVSLDSQTPIEDPLDKGGALVLRKPEGVGPLDLQVYEFRPSYEAPKKHIVGKIMKESPFFYFSDLGKLDGVQIYKGDPATHPEMLEINSSNRIGENPTAPLL